MLSRASRRVPTEEQSCPVRALPSTSAQRVDYQHWRGRNRAGPRGGRGFLLWRGLKPHDQRIEDTSSKSSVRHTDTSPLPLHSDAFDLRTRPSTFRVTHLASPLLCGCRHDSATTRIKWRVEEQTRRSNERCRGRMLMCCSSAVRTASPGNSGLIQHRHETLVSI